MKASLFFGLVLGLILQVSVSTSVNAQDWSLTGNAGTNPVNNFIGTTDNQSLEIKVNNQRALRIEPNPTSPNLIGGFSGNSVTSGVLGGTIGGGGRNLLPPFPGSFANLVTDDFGTVGGGIRNRAGDNLGTTSDRIYATVGGGNRNTASGTESFVGGGSNNTASGDRATIGGGNVNTVSGTDATVPGGRLNVAAGNLSFAAGNRAKANHTGAFVWADSTAFDFASTAANQFRARALGGAEFVVQNGLLRLEPNATSPNVIVGSSSNSVRSGVIGATISGGGSSGSGNQVTDNFSTVGGGNGNRAGTAPPQAPGINGATVAGGLNNIASHNHATVGGGSGNLAEGEGSTVAGGRNNSATGGNLGHAAVGGGSGNTARGFSSAIAGGAGNDTSAGVAFIGAGRSNIVSGEAGMVPGGQSNTAAGTTSFAAGNQAKANHSGSFVWGDFTSTDIASSANNQFTARASGGVRFFSNGTATTGVLLSAGGGSWASASDRNTKENFALVDGRKIVERLAAVPVMTWNYKSQNSSLRHIGPMGQDFHAAFGVGEDDKHITTIDADGVALASIQGLYQMIQEKDAQITSQHQQIRKLEARLEALERALEAVLSPRK